MRPDKRANEEGVDRWEQLAQELLGEESQAPNILPTASEPEPVLPPAHDLPQPAGFAEAADSYAEPEDVYSAIEEYEEFRGAAEGEESAQEFGPRDGPPPENRERGGRRGRRGRRRGRSDHSEQRGPAPREQEAAPAPEPVDESQVHEAFDTEGPGEFADLVPGEPRSDDEGDEAIAEAAASGIPTWAEAISYLKVVPAEGAGSSDRGGAGGRPRGGRSRRGRDSPRRS